MGSWRDLSRYLMQTWLLILLNGDNENLMIFSSKNYLTRMMIMFVLLLSFVVFKNSLSRNQLNQKLNLMIEASIYVLYSNMPPHMRIL